MLKSSLLIVLRGLRRERVFALVNITGLVAGIACFLILALYLRSELTYDQHFENHDRIYRLAVELETNGKVARVAVSSMFAGELLKQDYADVIDFVRIQDIGNERQILRNGDKAFYWEEVVLGEQNLFEIFSHDIIYGDPATALIDPLSIAVSDSLAKTYFGDRNPIGETLEADTAQYKITLVYGDLPHNTHLTYDAVISFNRNLAFIPENFNVRQGLWALSLFTYLLMPEDYDVGQFEAISNSFYDEYLAENGVRFNSTQRFHLEPLADIHLNSVDRSDRPTGNKFYVYTFGAIALFILLVACINYMNLATARSAKRAKEIGMRKVLGATRQQLVAQFMAESIALALISTVIAVVVVQLLLGYTPVDDLLGKQLSLDLEREPGMIAMLLALAVGVGAFSGLYPALYLSFIQPIAALKGSFKPGSADLTMRQALVLVQFTISVGVIACTILMAMQMSYVNSKPLGFDKENRIVIKLKGADVIEKAGFIKNDLRLNSDILGVSLTAMIPGTGAGLGLYQVENNEGVTESQTLNVMFVDDDFLDVMDITLAYGRGFDPATEDAVLVNETAVRQLGWDQALGKRVTFAGTGPDGEPEPPAKVVGVVEDFHYESLHQRVGPLVMFKVFTSFEDMPPLNRLVFSSNLIIKTTGENTRQTLNYISERWPEYDPKHPFGFQFLDDMLNERYVSEQQQMTLIGILAGICILISCLGLFGLSAFTTQQRTREIGIRKILGASTATIIFLFMKSILGLIAIASVLASGASYYVISQWLLGFEYKTGINLFVFLLAATLAALIAFATITLQSYKTARASPIVALRYE